MPECRLKAFGARKVEANALVVRPEAGRELCRQTILKYISANAPVEFAEKLKPHQDSVEREIKRLLREEMS